jgi:hypothetical protein
MTLIIEIDFILKSRLNNLIEAISGYSLLAVLGRFRERETKAPDSYSPSL